MTDGFYDRTAEYVAVLLRDAWTGLGPALTRAVSGMDTGAGPVLDIGAGTGLGTAILAAALPGAAIVAVEPNQALRTALLARCVDDEELRRRVTVLGDDVLSAALPDRLSGVVAMNVLGHFPAPRRRALWRLFAERLDAGGWAVFNLQPPFIPVHVPATPMAEVRVGALTYVGVAAAEPSGESAIRWDMTYRVEGEEGVLTEFTASDEWAVATPEALAQELAEAGLVLAVLDPDQQLYQVHPATS